MKRMSQYWLVVVFTLLVGVVGLTGGPLVLTASAVSPSALVIDVQSFGQTYGEWSARWWQWAFSIPAAVNPVLDLTGENCGQGQTGNVWFLAGTFGGPATRTCTIPTGKGIFFPVLNIATFAPFPYETLNDLRAQAAADIDKFTVLELTIDHINLRGLQDLRVQSPVFSLTVPDGGLLGPGSCPPLVPPASPSQLCNPVVSDGFWVLLSPLHKGDHVLHFHAADPTGSDEQEVLHSRIVGDLGATGNGRSYEREGQALRTYAETVVDEGAALQVIAADVWLEFEHLFRLEHFEAGDALALVPCLLLVERERVVQRHARADSLRVVGQLAAVDSDHRGKGIDEVGGDVRQRAALTKGLANDAELEVSEIPEAAVDELRSGGRGRAAEVLLLDEGDGEAAGGGVVGDGGARYTAADHY